MKKFAFMLAVFMAFTAPAVAGYDLTKERLPTSSDSGSVTINQPADITSDHYMQVFDIGAKASELVEAVDLFHPNYLDPSEVGYSTALTGNPFQQTSRQTWTLASMNARPEILDGVTGKIVHLGRIQVMSSGAMTGLGQLLIECSGGSDILSIPLAALGDGVVLNEGRYQSGLTLSTSAMTGCPAGESVYMSPTGAAGTGATHVLLNLGYSVSE